MPKRKSKPKSSHRVFSREFKVGVACRMLAGENISALARELRMTRKDLYAWRDRFQAGGPEAPRGRGRPPKAEAAGLAASASAKAPGETSAAELEAARNALPNWSARSASNSWISIFFSEPCGMSGR
jgi:transposase-like protein